MNAHSFAPRALIVTVAIAAGAAAGFFAARLTGPMPAPMPANQVARPQDAPAAVRITLNEMAAAGIQTEEVRPGDLSTSVLSPAMVDAEIRGEGVLSAHVQGTVVQINNRLGDDVRAGDTLAVVESRDAAALAAARDVAESKLRLARSVFEREQSLYEQKITPRQDLEKAQADLDSAEAEARSAQAAADAAHVLPGGKTVAVNSPLTGTIISRTAELGQFVSPNTELFRVSDPRFIDIDVAVTAADAQRIRPGDHARVTSRTGKVVQAVVRSVSPTVNEQTRTANVVLDPLPRQPTLTPGELVQAEIQPGHAASYGVVVPEQSVQTVDGKSVVFVRTRDGFVPRPVVVGSRSAGMVSIASGLNPGETIATTNAFLLKAELAKGAGEEE